MKKLNAVNLRDRADEERRLVGDGGDDYGTNDLDDAPQPTFVNINGDKWPESKPAAMLPKTASPEKTTQHSANQPETRLIEPRKPLEHTKPAVAASEESKPTVTSVDKKPPSEKRDSEPKKMKTFDTYSEPKDSVKPAPASQGAPATETNELPVSVVFSNKLNG